MAASRPEFVCALKLVDDKWYIGRTTKPKKRILQHATQQSSVWTRHYKPIAVEELWPSTSQFDEDKYTLQYMKRYGFDNVRGGTYTTMVLTVSEVAHIRKQLQHATDVCFNCQQPGHFASQCNAGEKPEATPMQRKAKVQKTDFGERKEQLPPVSYKPDVGDIAKACLLKKPFDVDETKRLASEFYLTGEEKSVEQAFKLWQEAWKRTAVPYIDNGCFPRVLTEHNVKYWQAEAAKPDGEAHAIFELALCLHTGIGQPESKAKAAELYTRAAEMGHVGALTNLGWCYEKGIGVTIDLMKATQRYQRAVDLGGAGAAALLAWCYIKGPGVSKDDVAAARLLDKGARLGNHSCMRMLGFRYELDSFESPEGSVRANFKNAIYWHALSVRTSHHPHWHRLDDLISIEEAKLLGVAEKMDAARSSFHDKLSKEIEDPAYERPYYKTWDCQRGEFKRYLQTPNSLYVRIITAGAEEPQMVEPILQHLVEVVFLTRAAAARELQMESCGEHEYFLRSTCGGGPGVVSGNIIFNETEDKVVELDGKPFSMYLDHNPSECHCCE